MGGPNKGGGSGHWAEVGEVARYWVGVVGVKPS